MPGEWLGALLSTIVFENDGFELLRSPVFAFATKGSLCGIFYQETRELSDIYWHWENLPMRCGVLQARLSRGTEEPKFKSYAVTVTGHLPTSDELVTAKRSALSAICTSQNRA